VAVGTSGVISRIAKPVPPVVMIKFNPSISAHDFTWDWIAVSSSGTIVSELTDHMSGDSEKTSFSVGPDRSVDASLEAVSLTYEFKLVLVRELPTRIPTLRGLTMATGGLGIVRGSEDDH
jgi:hypothetical protein